ncbi:MAG: amylo-alpha-1,6-glucosidase [Conexivisphaerales archaeon]
MTEHSIKLEKTILQEHGKAERIEWLLTNGIGGYASSTVIGENTRGYHGLLIASLPYLQRVLLLSKIEEEVETHGKKFQLSTNRYPDTIHPKGYNFLQSFELDSGVSFTYKIHDIILRKSVMLAKGRNKSIICYEVLKSPEEVMLIARPLINCRDHHLRTREGQLSFKQEILSGKVMITSIPGLAGISISYNTGMYSMEEVWYRNMIYQEELERGLSYMEDHFCPGRFEAAISIGKKFIITVSIDDGKEINQDESRVFYDDFLSDRLRKASDQFLVRGAFGEGIIAGYHWFGEWGRDTAISIPGLLLVYGKNNSAKKIIARYLSLCRRGIIPAFISEKGELSYSSVDTSLWFIYAIYKYYAYTMDEEFIKSIFPAMKEIINYYIRGTDYGIGINDQGLLECRYPCMTWMDAKVDGMPTTDRRGLCVEVNALWYNALKTMESFARLVGEDSMNYAKKADAARQSFNRFFWFSKGRYLYDYIDGSRADESLRPNQIFSISLPFPVLDGKRWVDVLNKVEESLFTPFGLRTLDPSHSQYRARCTGDQRQRDLAYHNGTVWAWLLGPFISAKLRAGFTVYLDRIVTPFKKHMLDAGLGTISEIFDGDAPHTPRGCIAQAWSVAEIIRVLHEARLELK